MTHKKYLGAMIAAIFALPLGLASPALANDQGTFAGFYVGLGGAQLNEGKTSNNAPDPIAFDFSMNGGYVSALAGYRLQNGAFVFGAELDGNFGSAEDSQRVTDAFFTYDGQVGIGDITSLRAQFGYTPTENTLLFASVGAANVQLAARLFVSSPFLGPASPFTAIDARGNESGFIYGVGGEYAWGEHWRARLEYSRLTIDEFPFQQAEPFGPTQTFNAKANGNLFRATLNYQF
ncbi:MAG: porin family protein [Hyphomonadaceae bacterium]|nr:porin family protein [Hyphomonadaceae bacterium]